MASNLKSDHPDAAWRLDLRRIGAISAGHFYSHLGILLLPPLFPILKDVFAVSYTELGLALACLNFATLILQAPCGALVDRFGAVTILLAGHLLMSLAMLAIGFTQSYAMLLVLMTLAGVGNAVYHPADYSILSATIAENRLGRAFSIHTAAGHFGFAAPPLIILYLANWLGWQGAMITAGLLGVAIGLIIWLNRAALGTAGTSKPAQPHTAKQQWQLVTSLPVLASFAFFTMIAVSQGGLTGYSVASIALIHEIDLTLAAWPLTAFLTLSAIGVLAGGLIADRTRRHGWICMGCYGLMTVLLIPLALAVLPFWLTLVIFAIAGFANGFLSPARDLLVRAVTPQGQAGIVFGFVTTGFNVGGLIAPVVFGAVMDWLAPRDLFLAVSIACLLTIATIYAGQRLQTRNTDRAP